MRPVLAGIAAVLMCSAVALDMSCAPANSPQTLNPQAIARGTVETLETVWNDVAKGCVAVAQASDDKAVLQTCINALDPSRQAIIAAGAAVDTWTDADQKAFPCLIDDSIAGFDAVLPIVKLAGIQLPQVVTDGYALANMYAPQCKRDAGK